MSYEQPSIYLFSIRIDEPVTVVTDIVVSAVCIYAFIKLSNIPLRNKVHLYLKYYFLSMGIATFIGGVIGHGFLYLFDAQWKLSPAFVNFLTEIVGENKMNAAANPWKLPGWLTSMFSVALVERASIEFARPLVKPKVARFFSWLNVIELLIFVVITFSTLNFFFVEVHTFYGFMIIVLGFNGFIFYKTKNKGSKLFLIAVGFAAVAALFFMNEWAISKWFNHFDISHTFMAFSALFFYLGGRVIISTDLQGVKEIAK